MIEVADIKLDVLKLAMGIKSLEEPELYRRLEDFWCAAYKRGAEDTREQFVTGLTAKSTENPLGRDP
jgi:hypothetical protein